MSNIIRYRIYTTGRLWYVAICDLPEGCREFVLGASTWADRVLLFLFRHIPRRVRIRAATVVYENDRSNGSALYINR